jgi:hypothetical protein
LLERREQSGGTTQGLGVAGHALGAAVPAFGHQPGTLQHGHVLLDSCKRHLVVRRKFAHGRLGVHDPRQDVPTGRVSERAKQLVQGLRGCLPIYNHMVVDISTANSETRSLASLSLAVVDHAGR